MIFPDERVDAYLRALRAGLHALAPAEDQVPATLLSATLAALSSEVSGALLRPAGVHDQSGLPELPWLSRALAERRLALTEPPGDPSRIDRAQALEPALADRMRQREYLRQFLRQKSIFGEARLDVVTRAWAPTLTVGLSLDYVSADGLFMRLRIEADLPRGALGLRRAGAEMLADEALSHLLSRHAADPLPALREVVARTLGWQPLRLSRGELGPFWFPGVATPAGVPAALGQGLLLHLASEVIAPGLSPAAHRDPLRPPAVDPAGWGFYRERRFAAAPALHGPLNAWLEARGLRCEVALLVR